MRLRYTPLALMNGLLQGLYLPRQIVWAAPNTTILDIDHEFLLAVQKVSIYNTRPLPVSL